MMFSLPHERVRKFAEYQLKSMNNNFEVELSKGLFAGQRLIPVDTAGCYIPGGTICSHFFSCNGYYTC